MKNKSSRGHKKTAPESQTTRFSEAAQEPQIGLVREFVDFLIHQKKWWLPPVVVVLLLLGLLVLLSGSPAAPFIYTLW